MVLAVLEYQLLHPGTGPGMLAGIGRIRGDGGKELFKNPLNVRTNPKSGQYPPPSPYSSLPSTTCVCHRRLSILYLRPACFVLELASPTLFSCVRLRLLVFTISPSCRVGDYKYNLADAKELQEMIRGTDPAVAALEVAVKIAIAAGKKKQLGIFSNFDLWCPPGMSVMDFFRRLANATTPPQPPIILPPPPQQQRRPNCPCNVVPTSKVHHDDHKLALLRGAIKECLISDEKFPAAYAAIFTFNHERTPTEYELIGRRSSVSRIARLGWADNAHYKKNLTSYLVGITSLPTHMHNIHVYNLYIYMYIYIYI
jgi:hypothetical protein